MIRPVWRACAALLCAAALACDDMPRDPEHTLEDARGRVLHVGANEAPPWIVHTSAGASGIEAELVRGFARSIGARLEWQWAPLGEHMERLKKYELALVAAGLRENTAWRAEIGLTRPYLTRGSEKRVLAVPPGENALLVTLERYLENANVDSMAIARATEAPR